MVPRLHRVLAVRRLTAQTFALRLTREGVVFRAGQHVTVGRVGEPGERDYSLHGGEHEPFLEILVREVEGGAVSPRLGACRPGDELHVTGPQGVFVLDPRHVPGEAGGAGESFVFIATGTGIAPFHAMMCSYPGLDARVVHGVRVRAEAYDRGDFPPDRHVLCLSREPADPASPVEFGGRVTDWLRVHPPAADTHVFLCGNAEMIYEALEILDDAGVPPHRVSTEIYF